MERLDAGLEIASRALVQPGESKTLFSLLDEHSAWLRKDDWGWDATVIALGSVKHWRRLECWSQNWREHPTRRPDGASSCAHRTTPAAAFLPRRLNSPARPVAEPGRAVVEPLLARAALEFAIPRRHSGAQKQKWIVNRSTITRTASNASPVPWSPLPPPASPNNGLMRGKQRTRSSTERHRE